jgi:glycosyltransferase involved in cell wall biosynthesis
VSDVLKEAWTKRLLRAGYRASLGLHAMANIPASGQGKEMRVYYGGARSGDIGGPLVKIERLRAHFPERRWGYNLVYTLSNAPYLPALALKLLKRRGVPIVSNQNGVFYPAWYGGDWRAKNAEMAHAYHLADHVFWQSDFCRRAADRFLGPRDGPGEVLYNAVDTARFQPVEALGEARPFTFLLTGKIDTHLFYRIEASLRGLAAARAGGLDAHLRLAGWMAPEAEKRTRDLARALGLGEVVSSAGPYTQEQAPELYGAADAYLMLKHNDPCPNTVLEALACGLPVLYSDTGGVPELVGDEAGMALPCEEDWERPRWPEPEAVAEGMMTIARHHGRFSAAARRRAVERFDIAPWIERHRAVFSQLVEQRS